MIGLGISVGILGIAVIVLGSCMLKKRSNQLKAKRSDEDLGRIEYNPAAESVRIIEGVDPLEELQRRILRDRIRLGINRGVENISWSSGSEDTLFDLEQTYRKTINGEVCWVESS